MSGRIWGTLNFGVLWVEKCKFRSVENIGYGCRNSSVSEKVQIFGEGSILMKCSLLYGGLSGGIKFLMFENFYMVFGKAKVWVKKSFLYRKIKIIDTGQFFWFVCRYCSEIMFKSSIWSNLFH